MTPSLSGSVYQFTPSLANIDLELYHANGFSLGTLVDQSISSVDNTQLLYDPGLAAGTYALEVSRQNDGLGTWNSGLAIQAVPEPSTIAAISSGAVVLAGYGLVRWRRRRGHRGSLRSRRPAEWHARLRHGK